MIRFCVQEKLENSVSHHHIKSGFNTTVPLLTSSCDSGESIRVFAGVSASWLVLSSSMFLVHRIQVDFTCSANLLLMTSQRAVRELIWRVLDVGVSLLSALPVVEMDLVAVASIAFLSVDLVLKVDEELFQGLD